MKDKVTLFQTGSDQLLTEADRRARVLALKRAVAAGTYQCNDQAVAESLLLELLWQQWERRQVARS